MQRLDLGVESVKLQWEHRDPADRVVVAIAKKNQASIITADQKIANFYSSVLLTKIHLKTIEFDW